MLIQWGLTCLVWWTFYFCCPSSHLVMHLSGLLRACSGRFTSCFRHRPFLRWTAPLSIWILLFPRRWFLLDYTNCASLCEFLRTNLASRPDEIVDKGIDWLCFVKREGFHWDKDMGWWRGSTGGRHSFQQSVHRRPFFFFFLPPFISPFDQTLPRNLSIWITLHVARSGNSRWTKPLLIPLATEARENQHV